MLDTRSAMAAGPPSSALWGEPLAPHSLENVGQMPLHIISVELKTPEEAFAPADARPDASGAIVDA